jgi:nitrile hydratase
MNGAHDMGGGHGFGPVKPEPNEPAFHSAWEGRAFALTVAMGATGEWNIDESRFARESQQPAAYLAQTYYEIWYTGLERLLLERGLVGEKELAAGRMLEPARPVAKTMRAADVAVTLGRGGPVSRPATAPPRFTVGNRVRMKNIHPRSHTRLPRYVRGHVGIIERIHGCHVYPDKSALGVEEPQWLYAVRFDGRELWGPDGDPTVNVSVDAFEPYLDPT